MTPYTLINSSNNFFQPSRLSAERRAILLQSPCGVSLLCLCDHYHTFGKGYACKCMGKVFSHSGLSMRHQGGFREKWPSWILGECLKNTLKKRLKKETTGWEDRQKGWALRGSCPDKVTSSSQPHPSQSNSFIFILNLFFPCLYSYLRQ